MTTEWTVYGPEYYLDLINVLGNATPTQSDAGHVTYEASFGFVVFEGTFTGAPPSDGTVTAIHLTKDGQAVLDITGLDVSYAAIRAGIAGIFDDTRGFTDLLQTEDAHIVGSQYDDEIIGTPLGDVILGGQGDDRLYAYEGNDRVKGGAGDDWLWGDDGRDVLKGNAGDDGLAGGAGRDLLIGGGGADRFYFGPDFGGHSGVDTIRHFKSGVDSIGLLLDGIDGQEALPEGQFHVGRHAADSDDLVIYDRKSGNLYIDKDGAGGEHQVKFAKVEPGLKLSHGDFDLFSLA